jgi:hypothetical protein
MESHISGLARLVFVKLDFTMRANSHLRWIYYWMRNQITTT